MVMNTIGIMEDRANDGSNSLLQQKISVLGLMQYALQHIHTDNSKTDIKSFPKKIVTKINAAHEMVLNAYQQPFPGMEKIAKQVDMSESNLKKYFKLIYGKTLVRTLSGKAIAVGKIVY
jgi:AraC-like DNA-binding protein